MRICRVSIAVILGCLLHVHAALGTPPDSLAAFWVLIDSLPNEEAESAVLAYKAQLTSQQDWEVWASMNIWLMDTYSSQKKYDQSIKIGHENIQQLEKEARYDSLLAHSYLLTGENYFFLNEREKSIEHLQTAFDYFLEKEATVLFVRCALGLGNNYLRTGRFSQADSTLKLALTHAEKDTATAPVYFAQIYNNLLVLYFIQGDYPKALEYAPEALAYSLNKEGVAPEQMIKDLTNAGVVYRRLGDYDRAELYLRQALETHQSIGDPDFSSYNNLGALYLAKGEYASAVPLLEQAVEIVRNQSKEDRQPNYFSAFQNLADAYLHLEKWTNIQSLLDETLSLHQEDPQNIETTWLNLAKLYQARNQPVKAKLYVEKGLAEVESQPNPDRSMLSELYRLQAELTLDQNPVLALQYCQQGMQILSLDSLSKGRIPVSTSPNPRQLMNILHIQGRAYEQLSMNHDDPVDYMLNGIQTWLAMDSLIDRFLRFYPMEGAQYQLLRNVQPAYQSAIRFAYRLFKAGIEPRKYAELGYYFSEKSKSVLLQARMREHKALHLGGIPEELREKDQQLRHNMSFYRDQIFQEQQRSQPDSGKIRLWNRYLFDYQLEKDELITHLQSNYPNYYRSRFQTTPADWESLLPALHDDQDRILMYSVGERFVFMWLLFSEEGTVQYRFQRISVDDAWKEQLSGFIRDIRDFDRVDEFSKTREFWQTYTDQAHHWYRELLEPVMSDVLQSGLGDLVIIPDGMLGYLPFELLLTDVPGDDITVGEYSDLAFVLKTWNVRYEYAASLLVQSSPFREMSRDLFAVAPVYEQAQHQQGTLRSAEQPILSDIQWWPPLSFNQEEVSAIINIAEGTSLIGQAAQEQTFREQAMTYQVLHLAMHAFANDEAPLYSGLVFSQGNETTEEDKQDPANDGILYAHELYNLSLTAEMAVLSACNTGIGKLAKGEGILSLARAFKYAGVPNTVMSLWQAEDHATSEIMSSFYILLRKGLPKHEALRQAKMTYLEQNKKTHPFYWATFVLYGDDQELDIRRQINVKLWLFLLGGIILMLGIAGYFWKRNYIR